MWAMQLLGHQVQKNTDMKNRIKSLRIHFLGANLTHSLPSWLPAILPVGPLLWFATFSNDNILSNLTISDDQMIQMSKSRIAQKWRVWKMWPVRFLLIGCTVLILTLWQWEGNWVSFWPAMLPHWSLKGLIGKWRQQLNLGQCPLHDMVSLGRTGCTQCVSVIISSVKK